MNASVCPNADQFAQCIAASKRVIWEIEKDVFRGRSFDVTDKYLPDGLSLADELAWLSQHEKRYLSQVQGRTYANMFGLVERFIDAKVLDVSRDHWLGDQTALEALVRFSAEELKHQALFRRVESLIAQTMVPGYRFAWDTNGIAAAVLSKSTWAVLALTMQIEVFVQVHYRQSIDPDENLSSLFKDVFRYHWKEESQHVILDRLEWCRVDASMTPEARDAAVNELIELVGAVDGILQGQATADSGLLLRDMRPTTHHGGKITDRATDTQSLSLAVHPVRHAASRIQHGAEQPNDNGATEADRDCARFDRRFVGTSA